MTRYRPRPVARLLAGVTAVLALAACGAAPATADSRAAPGPGCIESFAPTVDYFEAKPQLVHAKNFSISYRRSYAVVTVNQPYPGGAPESYVLVRCGAPDPALPADLAGAQRVTVPVGSLYSSSTTQLPLMAEIGALDALAGVGSPESVSAAEVRERIDAGKVVGYTSDQQFNTESVITAGPDVLLSGGTDDPSFRQLRNSGVPVIGWAEWLDAGPLAQAEWIKFMGLLTGKAAEADAAFAEIERRYTAVAAIAATAPDVPVLINQPYQGIWSVPHGGSTTGTLVRDAGGTWSAAASTAQGGAQRDLESVFATDGAAAAIWIAPGPWRTLADALATEPRFAQLTAVRSGQVWSFDKRLGPTGGNEYYERGVTRPDEILADLVAILHPDLIPGHEFVYYRQVTR